MDQADREIIRSNTNHIATYMDFDSVCHYLYRRGVFDEEHLRSFVADKSRINRNVELLRVIETRGPEAFHCLVDALVEAKQPHLAEKLGYSPPAQSGGLVKASTSRKSAKKGRSRSSQMGISTSVYKMSAMPKGMALIINNKTFTKMSDRAGTDVDCRNLEYTFQMLGFGVTANHNLKGEEMESEIHELSQHDHSQYDCMVLAILTHGIEGAVYGTDGIYGRDEGLVMIEDIISKFSADRCPTLKGKPKLFFVQACRGGGYDAGVEASDGDGPTGDRGTMCDLAKEVQMLLPTVVDSTDGLGSVKSKLPSQCDMLLGYSTVPGLRAWRNTVYGSWFVQGLKEIIPQHAGGEDLVSMMTMVNQRVSSFESNNTERYKQASVYVSTLIRKLYFFPDH